MDPISTIFLIIGLMAVAMVLTFILCYIWMSKKEAKRSGAVTSSYYHTKNEENDSPIKRMLLPQKKDGNPIQYYYDVNVLPEDGVNIVNDVLVDSEKEVEVSATETDVLFLYEGKVIGRAFDEEKAKMVSDWKKKGRICNAVLLRSGYDASLRFYWDKRKDNQFREQTVIGLTAYRAEAKQDIISGIEPGDELELQEDYEKADVVNVCDGESIGNLPKKYAQKFLDEGAYGAFYERGEENDEGIVKPYIRIFW